MIPLFATGFFYGLVKDSVKRQKSFVDFRMRLATYSKKNRIIKTRFLNLLVVFSLVSKILISHFDTTWSLVYFSLPESDPFRRLIQGTGKNLGNNFQPSSFKPSRAKSS